MNKQELKELIKQRPAVIIEYSRELRNPCWAVKLEEDPEYWLWSFANKTAALNFCKSRNLTVVNLIEN